MYIVNRYLCIADREEFICSTSNSSIMLYAIMGTGRTPSKHS